MRTEFCAGGMANSVRRKNQSTGAAETAGKSFAASRERSRVIDSSGMSRKRTTHSVATNRFIPPASSSSSSSSSSSFATAATSLPSLASCFPARAPDTRDPASTRDAEGRYACANLLKATKAGSAKMVRGGWS